jgi:hypothetical protein
LLNSIKLPSYDLSYNWTNTFSNHSVTSSFVIHGYASCPTWFTGSWWANASWSST